MATGAVVAAEVETSAPDMVVAVAVEADTEAVVQ